MVEARGVIVATMLTTLLVIGLLAVAVHRFSPDSLRQEACQAGQLPVSDCKDR